MPWPTPWFVGGANHQASIARLLSYAAFRGQEGVLGSLDCRVRQTQVPGPNIRVAPGLTNIYARGLGNGRQSYANALETEDVVGIAPTDSSGPRSDLIVLRVEDGNIPGAGWTPASAVNGPFQFTRVIPGVPANTNHVSQVRPNDSAITLARVDIPTNTGTITDAMITDLRSIADLSGERLVVINNPAPPVATSTWANNKVLTSTSVLPGGNNAYIDWPNGATWNVPIPSWATGVDVTCFLTPLTQGNVWGSMRVVLNGVAGPAIEFDDNIGVGSAHFAGAQRSFVNVSCTLPIPAASRGTIKPFKLQGKQNAGQGFTLADLTANTKTSIAFSLVFQRYPNFD